jgi:hypothetical protein
MEHDKMACEKPEHPEKSKRLIDLFQRLVMHHALWFNEVNHQMEAEPDMEGLWNVSEKSFEIQMKRFAGRNGDGAENKLPAPFANPDESAHTH